MKNKLIELIGNYDGDNDGDFADFLLENGVIVMPCKVGQTVYSIDNSPRYAPLLECEVAEIGIDKHYPYIVVEVKIHRGMRRGYSFYQIGKTVFLTKEEAEQALRKEDEGK